jgi:hypothetical protein
VAVQNDRPLINFLQRAAVDHELHQRFMDARDLEDFWNDPDILKRVNDHGWGGLSPDQKRLFREGQMLCHLEGALVAEQLGEPWSLDDVSGHQGPHFGPCWVLVRV